ncbi:dsDNA nuclease domain-containing protein [Pandoraea horticolens]|uniref:dsDNA nuclease domain-containing protein n=1 Tax=Pandoraea horticolens TaxID=2508298 RepID=UPI00123F4FA4|nr:dsDNA nuclease domain-containing protein [Pandoraea horticolens]
MTGGRWGGALSLVDGAAELLLVANDPKYSETGGGHGAKGVDFPRWWAVVRMMELETANEPDFLLLFESVQDVAELNSATTPTRARVYQVKKKDAGTWTWSVLTGTSAPKAPSPTQSKSTRAATASAKAPTFEKVPESALGKLHLSLTAFSSLPVEGVFLSNAGCDFPLASGGSAATTMPCSLVDLAADHVRLLTDAFASLSPGAPPPDLARVKLQKVAIHSDDLAAPAIAAALQLLNERSPEHAGQAKAFVDSLVMQISPLTRRTDACVSFEELVKERGFSRNAFLAALAALETVPDRLALLDLWLKQLQTEGVDFMTVTSVRIAAAGAQRDRLIGGTKLSKEIDIFCDEWIATNPWTSNLRPFVEAALAALKVKFSGHRDHDLMARFVMRAITKCVDQN